MSKEELQDDYKTPVSNEDMVEPLKQQYEQKRFLITNSQQKS